MVQNLRQGHVSQNRALLHKLLQELDRHHDRLLVVLPFSTFPHHEGARGESLNGAARAAVPVQRLTSTVDSLEPPALSSFSPITGTSSSSCCTFAFSSFSFFLLRSSALMKKTAEESSATLAAAEANEKTPATENPLRSAARHNCGPATSSRSAGRLSPGRGGWLLASLGAGRSVHHAR